MTDIGYQDGLAGFVAWIRKVDPTVKYRKAAERPVDVAQWFWLEKFEDKLLRHLKDEHDALDDVPPPPPVETPPPSSPPRLAPMTHYGTARADARFCVQGLSRNSAGHFVDGGGFQYDENGLSLGGRSGKFVSVLKPADSMDGLEPCQGYEKDGRIFPPWPPESYEV